MNEFSKIEKLYKFIYQNIEGLHEDASGGSDFIVPEFDLYAREYLKFAENQLLVGTTESLINCVSNLKRAVDCQIDTFFHILSLYDLLKKRNLKFEKKLDLLGSIGIFNSRSLTKLNTIRNKMEHEYSIPQISELDLYYDVVSAFISNLESAIIVLIWDEKNLYTEIAEGEVDTYFTIKLERRNEPVMKAIWKRYRDNNEEETIEVKFGEYRCFGFYLRCLYLINIKDAFASSKFVIEQIDTEFTRLNREFNKCI